MKKAAWLAWTLLLLMMLCGCRSVRTVETVRDVYKTRTDTVRDSICKDVFRNVYLKGDTVHEVERVKEVVYRYRTRNDTVIRNDTVYVRYTVEKKQPQSVPVWIFVAVVAVALIELYIILRRLWK